MQAVPTTLVLTNRTSTIAGAIFSSGLQDQWNNSHKVSIHLRRGNRGLGGRYARGGIPGVPMSSCVFAQGYRGLEHHESGVGRRSKPNEERRCKTSQYDQSVGISFQAQKEPWRCGTVTLSIQFTSCVSITRATSNYTLATTPLNDNDTLRWGHQQVLETWLHGHECWGHDPL